MEDRGTTYITSQISKRTSLLRQYILSNSNKSLMLLLTLVGLALNFIEFISNFLHF